MLAALQKRAKKKRRAHILRGIMMSGDIPSYHTNNAACSIDAEPCIKLLSEFGLDEKEAQL